MRYSPFAFDAPAGVRFAGLDLVDVDRFRLAGNRSGSGFTRRVFTDAEQEMAEGSWQTLGLLFGVKESVVKVAGGMPSGGAYRHIEIGLATEDTWWPIQLTGTFSTWARSEGVALSGAATMVRDGLGLAVCFAHHSDAAEAKVVKS